MPLLGYQLRAARQQIRLRSVTLFEADLEWVDCNARETVMASALLVVSGT